MNKTANITEYMKEWRIQNKDKIRDYHSKWIEEHQGYSRDYYRQKRENGYELPKSTCNICGTVSFSHNLERHKKSKKCLKIKAQSVVQQ